MFYLYCFTLSSQNKSLNMLLIFFVFLLFFDTIQTSFFSSNFFVITKYTFLSIFAHNLFKIYLHFRVFFSPKSHQNKTFFVLFFETQLNVLILLFFLNTQTIRAFFPVIYFSVIHLSTLFV